MKTIVNAGARKNLGKAEIQKMITSKIISICISELEEYKQTLLWIEGSSPEVSGYNCAIDCVKDSVTSRIDSLREALSLYDPEDGVDEKVLCYNEIASMLSVLKLDATPKDDSAFERSFLEKINKCIDELCRIIEKYD